MKLTELINNADISFSAFSEKFSDCFKINNIEFHHDEIKYFYVYYLFLKLENSRYNLTSITVADDVILKHFADSLLPLRFLELRGIENAIDIGTGAGFPLMPVFLHINSIKPHMLDSANKKINFLSALLQCLKMAANAPEFPGSHDYLDFSAVKIMCGRAEEIAKKSGFNKNFDMAVSRAVASLPVICELSAAFLSHGGLLAAYRGKNSAAEYELSAGAYTKLGLEPAGVYEYSLKFPDGGSAGERTLILFRKVSETPAIYPRHYSKIKKSPLS